MEPRKAPLPAWLIRVLKKPPHALLLPYKSRNPRSLIRILEPVEGAIGAAKFYLTLIKSRLECFACIARGSRYRVSWIESTVYDKLSGLRVRLRIPRGIIDSKVYWAPVWDGEFLKIDVEGFRCDVKVYCNSGLVLCGTQSGFGLKYLQQCLTLIE